MIYRVITSLSLKPQKPPEAKNPWLSAAVSVLTQILILTLRNWRNMLKTLLESSTECKLLQKLGHHKLHQVAAAKIQNLDAIREAFQRVKRKI